MNSWTKVDKRAVPLQSAYSLLSKERGANPVTTAQKCVRNPVWV